MSHEAKLWAELVSERALSRALRRELKKALTRVFELEFPQMGISRPKQPLLRIVKQAKK